MLNTGRWAITAGQTLLPTGLETDAVLHIEDGVINAIAIHEGWAIVAANDITGCRYGLHSMYSERARMEGNRLHGNLLGASLMNSDRLEFQRAQARRELRE